MQVREKVAKSRHTVFFQWFVAPEGRKVGSLKRRVGSHLGRWEMKNCTPLWRKANFEVKSVTNWGLRPLLEVEMSKKCTSLWREDISKSTCAKHTNFGPLMEVEMSKKCTSLWREAHFQVKMLRAPHARTTFWKVQMWSCVAGARHSAPCQKWALREGFCSISKNDYGRRGAFEEDLERCMSRGRRSTKDMFIRDVRRSGRWFPWDGLHFALSDLSIFERRLAELLRFWCCQVQKLRTSRRIASFWMLSRGMPHICKF